jgi:hypothetical protein
MFDHVVRASLDRPLRGRDRELEVLTATVATARAERRCVAAQLLGLSGCGLTHLTLQLGANLVTSGQIIGQADCGLRTEPNGALLAALDEAVRQIDSAQGVRRNIASAQLRSELAHDRQRAVELVPPLKLLLADPDVADADGAQPHPTTVPSEGESAAPAQRHVDDLLRTAVRALAQACNPLVVIFDNVHQADRESLRSIDLLRAIDDAPLVVVTAEHTQMPTDADARTVRSHLNEPTRVQQTRVVHVGALSLPTTRQIVADVADVPIDEIHDLIDAAHNRANGIAGVVLTDLQRLWRNGDVRLDRSTGRWQWSDSALEVSTGVTLFDLATQRLSTLDRDSATMLGVVAVAGQLAVPSVVARALGIARETALDRMYRGLGVIRPIPNDTSTTFEFESDALRRAAIAQLPPESLQTWRTRVADAVLADAPRAEDGYPHLSDAQLFATLALLETAEISFDDARTETHIALCERAAATAYRSGVMHTALEVQLRAIALLSGAAKGRNDDRLYMLHVRAARCALAVERPGLADQLLDRAFSLRPSAQQKVRAMSLLGSRWWTRGDTEVGLAELRIVLRELGHPLPNRINAARVGFEYLKTRIALIGRSPESLADSPKAATGAHGAVLDAMSAAVHLAYVHEPLTHVVMVLRGVRTSARHGLRPSSAYWLAGYGLLNCALGRNIVLAQRYGAAGMGMACRQPAYDNALRPLVSFAHNGFVRHWADPLGDTVEPLYDEYVTARAVGRSGFGYTCGTFAVLHGLLAGKDLGALAIRCDDMIASFDRLEERAFAQRVRLVRQAIGDLTESAAGGHRRLAGPWFDLDEWSSGRRHRSEFAAVAHTVDALLAVVLGDQAGARAALAAAAPSLRRAPAEAIVGLHAALTAIVGPLPGDRTWNRAVRRSTRKLRRFAEWSPANYRSRVLLAQAARAAAVPSRSGVAASQLALAVEAAESSRNPIDIALANRHTAMLHRIAGEVGTAALSDRAADAALRSWGALAAVHPPS